MTDATVAQTAFDVVINGETVRISGISPTTTLLDWLRANGRTGSKQGCAEGDCGACTIALVDRDAAGKTTYRTINSCIAFMPMFAGREIVTVEGLADRKKLHPVQSAMVEHYGSQCGYCTPGFVVSMFEAYYRDGCREPWQISDQLCGNLCRCTGYRPIRDAANLVLKARDEKDLPTRTAEDPFARRLIEPLAAAQPLAYAAGNDRFFRPTSLAELLALKQTHPAARLVAGATEIGVDLNKKFKAFPLLISLEAVPELTRITSTADGWKIGAAATLTCVEEALGDEFPSLAKMLRVFAARQIRNRATLGGNLVTASPIGDSAPVLLTLDASVVLVSPAGERTVLLADFFTGYRQTVMRADEVMREILLPRIAAQRPGIVRRTDFLKVSKRRELDISIVAGAFCVETDAGGIVRHARLAYGGVAVMPSRARKAEAALVGKKLGEVTEAVNAILRDEFKPIDDARSGADYRRNLVVSLWEKFVAEEKSQAQDAPLEFAANHKWPNEDGSRALSHESAVGHVTGRALYVDDTAQRCSMLEMWPVCAPHARARITRRDMTKARRAPGVFAVLMAEDIPGENNTGPVRHDEPLLARDEILFHGQMVAVVVGESMAVCRAAAALVEVEYEPLPSVVGLTAAIAQNSYHTEPHVLTRGDVRVAMAAAPAKLDGEFELGGQEHFYLETHAAWAEAGEEGTVTVHSSTQHPSEIQAIVSEVLHLSRHKVVVQSPRMGGGFGGKETQGNGFAALVALASVKTGRPVRIQLDRDLDMKLTGKRHPFHASYSVGYDREGRLLAVDVQLVSDGGWSLDLSTAICDRALFHLDNAYYIPAVKFSGRVGKTNVTSHTAFRGFGGPQGMIVIEEIIDRIARRLGLPPETVRERNLYHGSGETNRTHYAEDIGDNRIQEVWTQVLAKADFTVRRREVDLWNASHPHIKRGLAVTPVKFGISFTLSHYNQAGAYVVIYSDGSVQVNHGGTEMGQGLHTKILGVAMRELGLPVESIRLMATSTDKVPNTSATAASSGADLNGMAVAAACVTLRERLAAVAGPLLGIAPEKVEFVHGCAAERGNANNKMPFNKVCGHAYVARVSLAAAGYYKTPDVVWDWTTAKGRPFHYFACGAAVAEVEVDGFNGMHRVRRVDIVHDVGESLNPGVDRGQIEGGFVQGMGWLTREELRWDKQGRLLTHSASTYQIPAFSDAPVEFNVTLLPKAAQPNTIHGSKAVGEPPLMLAFSVREAIRDAIAAYGEKGGEVALASPATGEAIFASLQARFKPKA
ncbi:MAG TPA: xanthine dehydrogenase molybdopterin binding subunit [Lacunisphaera sp.]|jgi:xanthine dehydrogenase molybdopterin binding subunit/xanthine dehydrogenase small subunit